MKKKMKIAIVAANGKQGRLLVQEALLRGHEVTAIVRDANQMAPRPGLQVLERDLFALTAQDLAGQDVVIDAFGTWAPESLIQHQTSLKHLCDILSHQPPRLLVVGGAGSLYIDPEHTVQVMNTPGFPDAFKPLASHMGAALNALRQREDVKWTYVSPAGNFMADGARTGKYILGGETLVLNAKGESQISYADYAIAMIDEAECGKHIGERISVGAEG